MGKIREYRVVVDIQGIIFSSTTVSKAVYDRELMALMRLLSQVRNPSVAVGRLEVEDKEELTETNFTATFETTTIKLTAIACKPGYELVDHSRNLSPRRKDSRNEKSQSGQ